MKPIQLVIRKHVVVPTNYGSKYLHRVDLRQVANISYQDSYSFFKILNPQAPMTKDSEFAYWIYNVFGEGNYVVFAWQKGLAGFWVFLKLQCQHDGFIRTPKYESKEQKEKRMNLLEYRRLNKSLKNTSGDEARNIQEQIDNIKEDIDINKLIIELDKSSKYGCYPYLKTTMPVYRFHSYENFYENNNRESVSTGNSLW